jgi:hypothetical protein
MVSLAGELKKSTQIQAYQNVMTNYLGCINQMGEPLSIIHFRKEIDSGYLSEKDIISFAALMNTFEMLYIQKDEGTISVNVWDIWKNYFTQLIKTNDNYKKIFNGLKSVKPSIFHEGV